MAEGRWTKGLWSFDDQTGVPGHGFAAQVWSPGGDALATIEMTNDPAEATATAQLIAASPEMFAASNSAASIIRRYVHTDEPIPLEEFEKVLFALDAALTKALGPDSEQKVE